MAAKYHNTAYLDISQHYHAIDDKQEKTLLWHSVCLAPAAPPPRFTIHNIPSTKTFYASGKQDLGLQGRWCLGWLVGEISLISQLAKSFREANILQT
jgi:hypothetical protein